MSKIWPVERVLYSYMTNLGKLERLQRERARIMSVHGMQMEPNVGGAVVAPVERAFDELQRVDREIEETKILTVPVTRLIRDLPDELLYLLDSHYFKRRGWGEVWRKKGWSRWAGWRRKKELLRVAEEYLGPA